MCILLKLDYVKFRVSNFFPKGIEEKPLGDLLFIEEKPLGVAPSPLVNGRVKRI